MKTFRLKTKYCDDDVYIQVARYHDKTIALRFLTEIGEPVSVATVCLSHIEEKPAEGNVFIKDWSENEGILKALQEAEIISEPVRRIKTGFCTAYECKFLLPFDDGRVELRT